MRFVKSVAVGESHCFFLMGDASLWGVGSNQNCQLGLPRQGANGEQNEIVEEMKEIELEGLNYKKFNASYFPRHVSRIPLAH